MKNSADYWKLKACARQQLTTMLELKSTGGAEVGGATGLQENHKPPFNFSNTAENQIYKVVKRSGIGNAIQNWSSALCDFAQSVDCAKTKPRILDLHLNRSGAKSARASAAVTKAANVSPRASRTVGGSDEADVAKFFAVGTKLFNWLCMARVEFISQKYLEQMQISIAVQIHACAAMQYYHPS